MIRAVKTVSYRPWHMKYHTVCMPSKKTNTTKKRSVVSIPPPPGPEASGKSGHSDMLGHIFYS